jgi:hypothetical protein
MDLTLILPYPVAGPFRFRGADFAFGWGVMRLLNAAAAAVLALCATSAIAAEGSGEAVAVTDVASASGPGGGRALAARSMVRVGDTVATDATGEAQLRFSDGTRMVVGPNSALAIDELLFRANAAENKFTVRALGGAFRFLGGEGDDKGYTIRTPSATIGVRGTAFDVTVTPEGETRVVLLEGEVTLCAEEGKDGKKAECKTIATPCAVLQTRGKNEVEEIAPEEGRKEFTRENFPYVRSDENLRDEFRVAGGAFCLGGGLSNAALPASAIPAEAVIIGGLVIVGGAVIAIIGGSSSSNSTNK